MQFQIHRSSGHLDLLLPPLEQLLVLLTDVLGAVKVCQLLMDDVSLAFVHITGGQTRWLLLLNTRLSLFLSELMIYLWLAGTSQQPISKTTWLKVTPHCNHCNHYFWQFCYRWDRLRLRVWQRLWLLVSWRPVSNWIACSRTALVLQHLPCMSDSFCGLSGQITVTAKYKTQHIYWSRLAIHLIEQDIKKLSTANQLNCSVTRFVAANDWAWQVFLSAG